jgi:lysophospholipase L1-like esterase
MNTNPDATVVLCYGDSNTNGTKPDRSGRFDANERWTGILQTNLEDGYYVIEEGLGGRTTDLEHYNPGKPSRNGLVYFKACIDSHMPLDVITIMLGTNDLKTVYNRSAEDVAEALRQYPEYVKGYCNERNMQLPKMILVSPPYMDEKASKFVESMPQTGIYDEVSAQKSRQFAEPIKKVADETGCIFFDAASITKTGDDGCHLDQQSHQVLGDKLSELIKGLAK